jgi:uncharacterized protein (TIGR03083 family)
VKKAGPVLTAHLFAPVNDALVDLLRSLEPHEWNAPTVAGRWTVRDVAAHLLDTTLRRLAMHRDAHSPALPTDAFAQGLAGFVNTMNAEGVAWARRLSADLLVDMHQRYGAQMAAFFESLDPMEAAKWSVSWAGENESPCWFDLARELTERWHHQQQIRDAVARPPLFQYLEPVLDTFVRAMPFTYRGVDAPRGTGVVFRTVEEGEGVWSLVREDDWTLYTGAAKKPTTRITMRGDKAWRIFTRQKIDPEAVVEGEPALAAPLLGMVGIV